ncbi:MAG TPA: universal stress protein [Ktedonobacterales bacterium]|nr:universal stress protein [Ktedonobacterales bacterium]
MSQQDQQPEQERPQANAAGSMMPPSLSEYEAVKAHEEALEHANRPESRDVMASAHGRAEEETRRLSERMTREEQERRKALAWEEQERKKALALQERPAAPRVAPMPGRLLPTPTRIHSTLVALDGSPYAERSLPYAAALAQLTGSALMLGTCVRRGEAREPIIEAIADDAGMEATREGDVGQTWRSLIAARAGVLANGVTTRASIVYAPDAADGLITLQETINAEALAVATHARTGIERAALGSVADEVARRGRGLTLVVPPLAPEARIGAATFERALVPLDGSALSEQTLRFVLPLLQRDMADATPASASLKELTLFFVAEEHAQIRDAEYYLDDLREALLRETKTPVSITTRVVLGSAPGSIVAQAAGGSPPEVAHDERYDLIIMATHGRSGISRWFYGSAAMYVLAHSVTPVLLVRANQTQ